MQADRFHDFKFWQQQIDTAKTEHKEWLEKCDKLDKIYTNKDTRINMLYSNTQVLTAALLNNEPRPEVTRRFYNALDENKRRSKLYAMTARISQAAIEFYNSRNNIIDVYKQAVKNMCKYGRGVVWYEYNPTIEKVERTPDTMIGRIAAAIGFGQIEERVADRDIRAVSLNPREYLCSWAEKETDIWWKARRHLLDADDIEQRFDYRPQDNELTFVSTNNPTKTSANNNRGEVWEIWNIKAKERIFILLSDRRKELLDITSDPYSLEKFFPCVDDAFLTETDSIIPYPEYFVYAKMSEEINELANKNADLEKKIKYVTLTQNKDQSLAQRIHDAQDGDTVAVGAFESGAQSATSVVDTKPAQELLVVNQNRIDVLKQSIWEICGISDLMRGASDPRETAQAQKLKGVYGGLRFRDRQVKIQFGIRSGFRIIGELVAENWDWETLSQIAAVDLATSAQFEQARQIVNSTGVVPQGINLNEPTSDMVMQTLRDDKLRNYVIDIESTATDFDNKGEQMQAVQKLTEVAMNALSNTAVMQTPEFADFFVGLVKLNMAPIKCSTAISSQMIDSLTAYANKVRAAQNQPQTPTLDEKKLQSATQIEQIKIANNKEIEQAKLQLQKQKQDGELAIKQRQNELKEFELAQEARANAERVAMGAVPDTNIG